MNSYFYDPQRFNFQRQPLAPSYIRLLHASPNAPAVDIYINGNLAARNFLYRGFTEYFSIPEGNYNFTVFPAGQTVNPVLNTNIFITGGTIITVAVAGLVPNIFLIPIAEPRMPISPGKLMLKFVHLSPNTPNVDVSIQTGVIVFRNIAYQGITQYIPLDPGTYTFNLLVAGTGQRLLYVPNIRLLPGRFYTIYAIGLSAGNPPLQVLIPLDGNTYIM